MKSKRLLVVLAFIITCCSLTLAQTDSRTRGTTRILNNRSILHMHEAGIKPSDIIATISTSECRFDTFPPVLHDLERRGVAASVLNAMALAPYGPPTRATVTTVPVKPQPQLAKVQIPAGTVIEVEPAFQISTADVEKGALLTFFVSRQVFVNKVLVITRGAVARARVIKSKGPGAWGRGGRLIWKMEDVTAVDGTLVPIEFSGEVKGTNRSKSVVAAAIVTGAIVFPYTPPAGLIWGLKKGEHAVAYKSLRSKAMVSVGTDVAGVVPEKKRVIYHSQEQLKAAETQTGATLPGFNNSFRATPLGRH